jgi:phenylacetate-CoA ligase
MIDYTLLYPFLLMLRGVRRTINTTSRFFLILNTAPFQPFLSRIGQLKAYEAYLAARRTTPAYRKFLATSDHQPIKRVGDWGNIPITTKDNYVKKYSIEERCQGGKIPARGVVIDESSGSSGTPNSWVRGAVERRDVKRALQITLGLTFKEHSFFFLNCFALGPWATGMNVSMSLVDVGIMKSLGPDKLKLENTLKLFGPNYHYLITGYPPFIKNFVDTTELDLSQYDLNLVVGGESISEALRDYLLKYFKTVRSSYGASDLEINMGGETDLAIDIRRQLTQNTAACQDIFGSTEPPMIFQYDPLDYVIETNEDRELIFTITRFHNAAPKIRYNLHDIGAVYTYRDLRKAFAKHGLKLGANLGARSHFPFLCVYGRGDLTVAFYGAKIFTTNIEAIINENAELAKSINTFQMKSFDDDTLNRRLEICLERKQATGRLPSTSEIKQILYDGLIRINQDFREVTKMFTPDSITVKLVDYGTGPFATRDIRVKNKYIAD